MRSMLAATLMMATATGFASAQTAAPASAATKPKPAATAPARPALQTPADTAKAMALAERQAIQSDLAWTGHYNGVINGEVSDRMVAAIKSFQKDRGAKQTGVLNPQEREQLADAAKKLQANVGWKMVTEAVTGARLGLPTKLVPKYAGDPNGAKWSSSTGTIQIELARRKEATPSTAKLADQEKKLPDRKVEYSAVKPDFFVLSGTQGLKKFYVRGQFKDSEVRILTILYDQATEGTMEPVVIAMSSAFNPFPAGAQAGPPPRKSVEYATGIVVDEAGAIVTDRDAVDGCVSIVVAGFGNADRVAEDKDHGLALLRIYGARGLKPLGIAGAAAKSAVDVIGIADPQNQGGGAAASSVKSTVTPVGSNGELALNPVPSLGFTGAAALDADGRFAGVAQLKSVVVAGPPNGAATTQAMLVGADSVREFLKRNNVTLAGSRAASDAKASVVRVICVRK
ncbi:MAG: peptidoglycan-binding protein [Rhodopseudomonas sp.]|uniref:serine protease n=1 Tax=Rhodopseudomonas sp. TaxID=1078 RepID=UPI0017C9B170|nr:serine protease [Rhodopseudomonas sp.]NVN88447.1 peptidoglycan-binding protein [Rhodopseudomonas sp.]